MMTWNYKALLGAVLLLACSPSFAQDGNTSWQCSSVKSKMAAAKTTVANVAEDNYDMKYVKLDLHVDNQSSFIAGHVTTVARVVAPSFSTYVFELSNLLTIDTVMIDGVLMPVDTAGDVKTVTLTTPLSSGTMFTVDVVYHGTPAASTPFFSPGMSNLTSPSWGNRVTSTLSESYRAKDWWPTKQSLTDKIDSVDMWLTVPDTLKAGSNGVLTQVTHLGGGYDRYEWKERNPMDYYLISLAVAGYVDYSYYMHYTGSTDSMLIQNYVYNNPATLPHFKSVIDSVGLMVDYFSTLYGRYPFWQEKYGHCMAPINGGMEHQTMTTLGNFQSTIVAHELGHQWFGDNVTCGTWADICMNESFAAYTEYLYIDHFWNHARAVIDIVNRHHSVKYTPGGSVYVDDTTDENRIFDSRLSYDKGACMLHMLRFVVNDDSSFFKVYRLYQQQYAGGTGTIMDFKNVAATYLGPVVNGISLDTFFNQWAYLQGYPIYNISWNQSGSDVYLQVSQASAIPSSVPLFALPMEVKLRSAAGDTTVRIINTLASQQFHFTWDRPMINIVADPNSWLLDSVQSVSRDVTLAAGGIAAPAISVHPNPASISWTAEALPLNSDMALTDITGRILWQGTNGAHTTAVIPATGIATGIYLLRITNAGVLVKTCKLTKE